MTSNFPIWPAQQANAQESVAQGLVIANYWLNTFETETFLLYLLLVSDNLGSSNSNQRYNELLKTGSDSLDKGNQGFLFAEPL